MPDQEEITADTTAVENDTQETKTESPEVVDYDKELSEQVEKFETAEKNREGYAKRKALTTEEETETELTDIDTKVEAAIDKAITKAIPKLQSTLAEDTVENVLNELSLGNDSKKKLIRFHFENSIGSIGTIRERMENASLIADKKVIFKKQSEMATALKNRAGLGASGLGSSTEGQVVADNILSTDQLRDLKAKGWDDKKIERFKKNLRR